jgi:hypothetical protein
LSLVAGWPNPFASAQSDKSNTTAAQSQASQRHAQIAAAKVIPPQSFEQIVPYWTAESGWHTELQLRNNLISDSLTVTPILASADGTETPLNDVTVLPGEVKTIDLHRALAEVNSTLAGQPMRSAPSRCDTPLADCAIYSRP